MTGLGWRIFGHCNGGRKNSAERSVCSPAHCIRHCLTLLWTLALSPGLRSGCCTHRHHDPSISFGALEAIQSRAALKATGDILVNPGPTSQPGPQVLPQFWSEEHHHLQVVLGDQILLCVLVVLWAPSSKTNTRLEKSRNSRVREMGAAHSVFMGSGDDEPLTGGRRARGN